jgi:hypothetical protein
VVNCLNLKKYILSTVSENFAVSVSQEVSDTKSKSRDLSRLVAIHRLSINIPTKRGKEKSRSDGHCQREKEMDDHLLACQEIFEIEPLNDTLC